MQVNAAFTSAFAGCCCPSAPLRLQQPLLRQCRCCRGYSTTTTSTRRQGGTEQQWGHFQERSEMAPMLFTTARQQMRCPMSKLHRSHPCLHISRAPPKPRSTSLLHSLPNRCCTDSRYCSVPLLFSASAIAAAPFAPMLLLLRLHTPQFEGKRGWVRQRKIQSTASTQCQIHNPHMHACMHVCHSSQQSPHRHPSALSSTPSMQPNRRCTDKSSCSVLLLFSASAIADAPSSPMTLHIRLHKPQQQTQQGKPVAHCEHSSKPCKCSAPPQSMQQQPPTRARTNAEQENKGRARKQRQTQQGTETPIPPNQCTPQHQRHTLSHACVPSASSCPLSPSPVPTSSSPSTHMHTCTHAHTPNRNCDVITSGAAMCRRPSAPLQSLLHLLPQCRWRRGCTHHRRVAQRERSSKVHHGIAARQSQNTHHSQQEHQQEQRARTESEDNTYNNHPVSKTLPSQACLHNLHSLLTLFHTIKAHGHTHTHTHTHTHAAHSTLH